MDYEGFMLTRMREAYDATRSTEKAVELGLARTGKLVTSGALVLMFAFFTLSLSPGYEIKQLAIGLAAGIILDATVIRALLVPALMHLLGRANWWMPAWADRPPQPRTPHRPLALLTPDSTNDEPPPSHGKLKRRHRPGRLIHEYHRKPHELGS